LKVLILSRMRSSTKERKKKIKKRIHNIKRSIVADITGSMKKMDMEDAYDFLMMKPTLTGARKMGCAIFNEFCGITRIRKIKKCKSKGWNLHVLPPVMELTDDGMLEVNCFVDTPNMSKTICKEWIPLVEECSKYQCQSCLSINYLKKEQLEEEEVRCGLCASQLYSEYITYPIIKRNKTFIPEEQYFEHFCGVSLKQLMKLGYGDFYDILKDTDQKKIIEHDLSIYKAWKNWSNFDLTLIPNNTEQYIVDLCEYEYKGLIIVNSPRVLGKGSYIAADLQCMFAAMKSSMEAEIDTLVGQPYYQPQLELQQINCINEIDNNIIGTKGVLSVYDRYNVNFLSSCMNRKMYLIIPKIGSIPSSMMFNNNNYVQIAVEDNFRPIEYIDTNNYIMINNVGYTLTFRMEGKYFFGVELNKGRVQTDNMLFYRKVKYISYIQPGNRMVNLWPGYTISRSINCELNVELLRSLFMRNLNGKTSDEEMRQYAVGYLRRRFTITESHNFNHIVDVMMIDAHINYIKNIVVNITSRLSILSELPLWVQGIAQKLSKPIYASDTVLSVADLNLFFSNFGYWKKQSIVGFKTEALINKEVCRHKSKGDEGGKYICFCCGLNSIDEICIYCKPVISNRTEVYELSKEKLILGESRIGNVRSFKNLKKEETKEEKQIGVPLKSYLDAAKHNLGHVENFTQDRICSSIEGIIGLPFVSMGHSSIKDYSLLDWKDRRNEWKNSCGVTAFNAITNLNVSEEECKNIIGRSEELSVDEIGRLAGHYGINVIIAVKEGLILNKVMDDSTFIVIIHGSVLSPGWMHYMEGSISVNTAVYYKCIVGGSIQDRIRNKLLEANNFDAADVCNGTVFVPLNTNLSIENTIRNETLDIQLYCENGTVMEVDDKFYLTNNILCMESSSGNLYATELDPSILDKLRKYNSDIRAFNDSTWLNSAITEDRYIQDDELIENEIRITLKNLCVNKLDGFTNNTIDFEIKLYNAENSNIVYSEIGLKDGDEVLLRSINKIVTIRKIGSQLLIDKIVDSVKTLRASKYNTSTGNSWRKLAFLLKYHKSTQSWVDKVEMLTDGVAGCGKSDLIKATYKNSVIIGRTKGSINNMKAYLGENFDIMSPFQYMFINKERKHNIIIDECFNLSRIDLLLLNNDWVEKIWLYGDHRQIPEVDFTRQKGFKEKLELLRVVKQEKVVNILKSKRVGKPLANLVQEIYSDFEAADHETTYDWKVVGKISVESIVKAVSTFQPTLILTMTTRGNNILREIYNVEERKHLKVKIDKVHSSQGVTSDRVLLILSDFGDNIWDLNGNKDYLYSAITRAKFALYILTDSMVFNGSLNSILQVGRGYREWYNSIKIDTIRNIFSIRLGDKVELTDSLEVISKGLIKVRLGKIVEHLFVPDEGIISKFLMSFSGDVLNRINVTRQECAILMYIGCTGEINCEKEIGEYSYQVINRGKSCCLNIWKTNDSKHIMTWPFFFGQVIGYKIDILQAGLFCNLLEISVQYVKAVLNLIIGNEVAKTREGKLKVNIKQASWYDMYCAGKEMWPTGMYLSKELHIKYNSDVAKMCTDNEARVMSMARLYSSKQVLLHCSDNILLEKLAENWAPNVNVNTTQSTHFLDEASQLLTILALYKVTHNRHNKKIGYYGVYNELIFMNHLSYINIIVPSIANMMTNPIIASIEELNREMFEKGIELKEGRNFISISKASSLEVIIIDENGYDTEIINELLSKGVEIWLIACNTGVKESGGYGKMHINRHLGVTERSMLKVSGVTLYKLGKVPIYTVKNNLEGNRLIPMEMYDLPSNIEEIKYGIVIRRVLIDINLFNKCYTKLISRECSFDDLIRYVQSLGLTYKISKGGMSRYKDFDPQVWIVTAYFAYITFKTADGDIVKKVTGFMDKLLLNREDNIFGKAISYVYSLVRPMINEFATTISEVIGDIVEDLQAGYLGKTVQFNKMLNCSKNLNMIYNIRSYIEWSIIDTVCEQKKVSEKVEKPVVLTKGSKIVTDGDYLTLCRLISFTGNREEVELLYNNRKIHDVGGLRMRVKEGKEMNLLNRMASDSLTAPFIDNLKASCEGYTIIADIETAIGLKHLGIESSHIVDGEISSAVKEEYFKIKDINLNNIEQIISKRTGIENMTEPFLLEIPEGSIVVYDRCDPIIRNYFEKVIGHGNTILYLGYDSSWCSLKTNARNIRLIISVEDENIERICINYGIEFIMYKTGKYTTEAISGNDFELSIEMYFKSILEREKPMSTNVANKVVYFNPDGDLKCVQRSITKAMSERSWNQQFLEGIDGFNR